MLHSVKKVDIRKYTGSAHVWENEQKTPHRKDKPETKESDYSWGSGRWGIGEMGDRDG